MVLGNCGPVMQPNNLIILSPEQLIPPLEWDGKRVRADEGHEAAQGSTALQNCCVSPFFTLYAGYCNPHCYRQQLVHRTGPDWQRVASVVTVTWKIIIQGQMA